MRPGGTPVDIPNTMVKAGTAEDTVPETAWESRWLPESKKEKETHKTWEGPGRYRMAGPGAYSSAG